MKEKGVDRARMAFRIRTRMVSKIKMNFKNSFKENLKCENCDLSENETQEPLMVCLGWVEELGALDVHRMAAKVEFFIRVMKQKKSEGQA